MRRVGAHLLWGVAVVGRFHCEVLASVHCGEQLVLHVVRGGRCIHYLVRRSESPSGTSSRLVQKESGKKRVRFPFLGGECGMPRVWGARAGRVRSSLKEPCFSAEQGRCMGLRVKESHVVCLSVPMRRCHVVLWGDDGHRAAVKGAQRGKPWREVHVGTPSC